MKRKLTIVLLLALCLVTVCPLKAQTLPVPDAGSELQRKYDYFYLESVRLKLQHKYDAAFDLLQHCLALCPRAASAQYELAQYYMYLQQPEQAEDALRKAVTYAPENFWYSQALVSLYTQQQQTDKAAALLEDMVRRFPDKLDPVYSLFEIYGRQERYADMIAILDRLEQRLGKNEQFTLEKQRIYVQMNEPKKALKEVQALVDEYPNELRYQLLLGDAYMLNKQPRKAYDLYRHVLDEEPDNAQAMYTLANYYEDTGQTDLYRRQIDSLLLNRKVESDIKLGVMRQLIVDNAQGGGDSLRIVCLFDSIMAQEPDDPALPMLYAQYLLSRGMNQKARPVLAMVLDLDPANTAARMVLLGEAVREEDYDKVIALCEGGVEANPDRLEFYFYLAIGYNQANRNDDVISICQRALTHVDKDSKKELVSDFYAILGDAYHIKGMNPEAFAAYEASLKFNPDNLGTLNNYAYFLSLERRDLDKAEEMSFRTVKAEPSNATYLDTYAWILFEKGNYAEARLYIDDAMKYPEAQTPDVLEHCGDIYYMTGEAAKAMDYWQQALDKGSTSKILPRKLKAGKYIPAPAATDGNTTQP